VNLLNIVALAVRIVVFTVVFSAVLVAISPLDFTGHLRENVPLMATVIIALIVMLAIIIIAVYLPDIITRE